MTVGSTPMSSSASLARSLWSALETDYYLTTSVLLSRVGVPNTSRPMVLKALHAMDAAGFVSKVGSGNFKWRRACATSPTTAEFEGLSSGSSPSKKKTCRCGGTGVWVNPRNPDDKRPCFFCYPTASVSVSGIRPPTASVDIQALKDQIDELSNRCIDLQNQISKKAGGEVKVITPSSEVRVLKDAILPENFQEILDLAALRENILLIGPTGCGKTETGALIAKSLDLPFSAISCSEGTMEHHLIGRSVPNLKTGKDSFISTEFLDRFENGGVFLLDEMDACNPNLLMVLNSALSNGYIAVPARAENPTAKMHADFICIATANTYGRGANRSYVGRNQLDEATLDRFRIGTVDVYYSEAVEEAVCPDEALRSALQAIRTKIEEHGLRRFMSTRFLAKAYKMHKGADWGVEKIKEKFFSGWSADELAKVL